MAKRRLIPKLLLKTSQFGKQPKMVLVTTVGYAHVIEIGDPVSQAKIYEAQAADELLFLHIDQKGGWEPLLSLLRATTEEIFMPFTVGGGVKTLEDFRVLLSNGADKVSINTAAIESPRLIREAADAFGSQCVVVSIDFKKEPDGTFSVWKNHGKVKTPLTPLQWALEAETQGAGEVLLSSIDRDGTRSGLELPLIKTVSEALRIPVIASGGCGLAQHFVDGFLETSVCAIAAGTYFSFKDENPMQTRARVRNAGIPIRTIV